MGGLPNFDDVRERAYVLYTSGFIQGLMESLARQTLNILHGGEGEWRDRLHPRTKPSTLLAPIDASVTLPPTFSPCMSLNEVCYMLLPHSTSILSPSQDGRQERVLFDKITSRISKLCYGLNMNFIDPIQVTQKVGKWVGVMILWIGVCLIQSEIDGGFR